MFWRILHYQVVELDRSIIILSIQVPLEPWRSPSITKIIRYCRGLRMRNLGSWFLSHFVNMKLMVFNVGASGDTG